MPKLNLPREDVAHILNILRQGTVKWSGRSECLRLARKRVKVGIYKNGNPIFKYHWQCATCKKWFANEKQLQVDHKIEIGTFCGNLNRYAEKMYERPNLQALCIGCHAKKTGKFNSAITKWKRKR